MAASPTSPPALCTCRGPAWTEPGTGAGGRHPVLLLRPSLVPPPATLCDPKPLHDFPRSQRGLFPLSSGLLTTREEKETLTLST